MISGSSAGSSSSSTAWIGLSFSVAASSRRLTTKPVVRFVPSGTSTREPRRTSSRRLSGIEYVNVPRTATGTATSANWEMPCTSTRISGALRDLPPVDIEGHRGEHGEGRQRIHCDLQRRCAGLLGALRRHFDEISVAVSRWYLKTDRVHTPAAAGDPHRKRSVAHITRPRDFRNAKRAMLVRLEQKTLMSDLPAARVSKADEHAGRTAAHFDQVRRLARVAGVLDTGNDAFFAVFQPLFAIHGCEALACRLAAENSRCHGEAVRRFKSESADNARPSHSEREIVDLLRLVRSEDNSHGRRCYLYGVPLEKRHADARWTAGEIRHPDRRAEFAAARRQRVARHRDEEIGSQSERQDRVDHIARKAVNA